jgi:hypothetical protein
MGDGRLLRVRVLVLDVAGGAANAVRGARVFQRRVAGAAFAALHGVGARFDGLFEVGARVFAILVGHVFSPNQAMGWPGLGTAGVAGCGAGTSMSGAGGSISGGGVVGWPGCGAGGCSAGGTVGWTGGSTGTDSLLVSLHQRFVSR